jgi:hypothetical protein
VPLYAPCSAKNRPQFHTLYVNLQEIYLFPEIVNSYCKHLVDLSTFDDRWPVRIVHRAKNLNRAEIVQYKVVWCLKNDLVTAGITDGATKALDVVQTVQSHRSAEHIVEGTLGFEILL